MSAAEHLQEAIDLGCTRDDHDHVGAHRDEVLEEVAVWLGKKAREYRGWTSRETPAEVLERMADKIRRGAVRPVAQEKDTREGESTPTFFQPGRTYSYGAGPYRAPELVTLFRVEHVSRHPERGHLRAIGWSRSGAPGARWHGDFHDEGEFEGWSETTAEGASHVDPMPTVTGRCPECRHTFEDCTCGGAA